MQNLKNKILNNVDIVEEASKYLNLEKKGQNFVSVCPFHNDNNPSLTFNSEKKIFKCFVCGEGGNVINFVKKINDITYNQALLKVAKENNFDTSFFEKKVGDNPIFDKNKALLIKLNEQVNELFKVSLYENKDSYEYLKQRNISDKTIEKFGIGYKSNDFYEIANLFEAMNIDYNLQESSNLVSIKNNSVVDFFNNRIMIPITDQYNNIVGFGSRVLEKSNGMKYLNSKDGLIFSKNKIVYNYYNCKNDILDFNKGEVIVTEGYMDVISLGEHNINNVVALMTKSISKNQVDLIKKLNKKILINLDFDNAGLNGILDIIKKLNSNNVGIIRLEKGYDPDEFINKFGREEYINRIKNPMSVQEFLYYLQENNIDTSSFNEKPLEVEQTNNDYINSNTSSYMQEPIYEDIPPERINPYLDDQQDLKQSEPAPSSSNNLNVNNTIYFNSESEVISALIKIEKITNGEEKQLLGIELSIYKWIINEQIDKNRAKEYCEIINHNVVIQLILNFYKQNNNEFSKQIYNCFKKGLGIKYDNEIDQKMFILVNSWNIYQAKIDLIKKDSKKLKDKRKAISEVSKLEMQQRNDYIDNYKMLIN